MILDEIALWVLIVIGATGLISLTLMAMIIHLLYRGLDRQTDILNQIRYLAMAYSGILELEDED